jgi:hypothetical protein
MRGSNFDGARQVADLAIGWPHTDAKAGWTHGRFHVHARKSEPGLVVSSAKKLELAAHPITVEHSRGGNVDTNQFWRARFDQRWRESDGPCLRSRNTGHGSCGENAK